MTCKGERKNRHIFYNYVFFMTARFTGSGLRTATELVLKVLVNRSDYILFPVNIYHKQLVYWCRQLSYSPLSVNYFCTFEGVHALIDSEYRFDKISCGFL